MASTSNSGLSGDDQRLASGKSRLDSALGRLEDAVLAYLSQGHNRGESAADLTAELEAVAADRDRLSGEIENLRQDYERMDEAYQVLSADYDRLVDRATGGAAADEEEDDLAAAYAALRKEHDRALAELEEWRNKNFDGEGGEDAARLLRELGAARSAHAELERSYIGLQQEVVILRNGGGGPAAGGDGDASAEAKRLDELKAEADKVAADLEARRAELDRLSGIRDEVADRLGRVINHLENISGNA